MVEAVTETPLRITESGRGVVAIVGTVVSEAGHPMDRRNGLSSLLAALLQQFGHQRGPSGLMAGA